MQIKCQKKRRSEWSLSLILAWLQEKRASQSSSYPNWSPHFAFTDYTDHYQVLIRSLKSLFTRPQKSKTKCLIFKSESSKLWWLFHATTLVHHSKTYWHYKVMDVAFNTSNLKDENLILYTCFQHFMMEVTSTLLCIKQLRQQQRL